MYIDNSGLKVYLCLVLAWVAFISQELSAAGISVWESDAITNVSEGQQADIISVRLDSQPLADISIEIIPATADLELNGDFPGDAILLYFTRLNWSEAQEVTIRAVQDGIEEGEHTTTLSFLVESDDPLYNGYMISDITVYISDSVLSPCPAYDIDGDCRVSIADLQILAVQWLDSNCSGLPCADISGGDGVDIQDFSVMASEWGESFGPVLINEFVAVNNSTDPELPRESWEVFDEDGDSVDWIELYNVSSETVDLTGWSLTDDSEDIYKWHFPAGQTIAANGYLIIYASGKDTAESGFIHTNFSLSSEGECLAIVDPTGKIIHEFNTDEGGFPAQQENISYGMFGYFTQQRYFYPATPGAANINSVIGTVADIVFSLKRGFFNEPITVRLSTKESGTVIRYTLNGSTPTESKGYIYDPDNPIYIDRTTTLRAAAFKTGWLPSNVETQTYIFINDVITQSPNGQTPTGWPNSYAVNNHKMDYGMDPDIVNNAQYADLMDDALLAIPTLSLVTDLSNLFNSTNGVYVCTSADTRINGDKYEKPVSLELINPDGSDGFQVDCGVRLRGGYSRSSSNPKHALRFFFRSMYGDAKLKYPLFGDEGTDEFDKIDLRTAANYSWHYDSTNGYLNTFTRDEWSRLVQGKLGNLYTKGRYYHLYINGQYWGVYQTEERADARFAASYMGGAREDYDVMKVDVAYNYHVLAAEGNNSSYRELYDAVIDGLDTNEYFRLQGMNPDATVNASYKRLLDVDNLIDFMLIDYFTADYDGPGSRFTYTNNFTAIFNRTDPDGFKWLQHDSEHSFSVYSLNNSCRENMVTPLTTDGANFVYFNPQWLHEQLANNVIEYRMRFADRVHALLDNGGLLTHEKACETMNSLASQLDMAIVAESARWGDSTSSVPRTKANWLDALQFTYNWINGTSSTLSTNGTLNARQDWPKYPREQRLKEQFRSVGWYSDLESTVLSSYGGKVETGYQLTMSNPNGRGVVYYTTDGSDPRELPDNINVTETVLVAENAFKYVLVPTANIMKPTGNVLAEVYNNIQGNALSALTSSVNYPANPNYRELWPSLAMPAIDHNDNYGTRVRAILYPPATGYYTFWITSDDNSSLRLSSDASPANAVEIAYLTTWSYSNEWYKDGSQQSEQIYLEYNKPYYLEALHKEGSGADNLNVGWSGPGISGPIIIPGQYLSVPENIWASVNYVPTSWINGTGAVGYENRPGDSINYSSYINAGINLQSQMYNKATSCYIRIPFNFASADINSLKLNLRYDDGCVVYLNGVEVFRDNVDGVLLNYNSQADTPRDDSISIAMTQVDISRHIGLLRNGNNVLAIQGLNDDAGSSDMLISAVLVAGVEDPGQVAEHAIEYTSPITLDISSEINTRVFDGVEWSPVTKAFYSVGPVSESLRITELMYHPELNGVEYLEIRNIGQRAVNLNKVSFNKGINHTFGDLWLVPDQFIVLTQDSVAFAGRYPDLPADIIVMQWDSGSLNNAGEYIVFCDASGEVIQNFEFNDWYDLTDGKGFSINIPDPTQGDLSLWNKKESWAVSTYAGGSPGELDEAITGNSIVINEVMSNPEDGMPDWIELKNNTSKPINIGGWYLSDSSSDLLKYQIEQGTVVPADGYLVLYDETSFGSSFGLSKFGEDLTLSSAVNGVLTGYQVSEDFDAAPQGVSYGRYQKSDGSFNFILLLEATPGRANSWPRTSPLVISEIMYNPAGDSDAEYIELKNISAASLQLRFIDPVTAEIMPWRLIDEDGVMAVLPTNVTLLRGEKFLLIKDISAFVQEYGPLSPYTRYMQWTAGKLSNSGEKVELQIPGELDGDIRTYIRADRVNYSDDAPWPTEADGSGYSLIRLVDNGYANEPENWTGGLPSPGN